MATLKERVSVSANGFQVKKESEQSEKKAYYNVFTLQDTVIEKNCENPLTYWNAYEASSYRVKEGEFVCVWEIDEEGNVEEYSFCYTGGKAQPRISWEFEPASKYGENAYMITIEWKDNRFERIHREHIWLKHKKSGRKFSFLRETLYPLDPSDNVKKDQYIITLPGDVTIEQLTIEADDLLRQKYLLVH